MSRTAATWDADSPQTGGYSFVDATKLRIFPNVTSTPAPILNTQGIFGAYILDIVGPLTVQTSSLAPSLPPNSTSIIASFSELLKRVLAPVPPSETPIPKGLRPIDIFVTYTVLSGTVTSITPNLTAISYHPTVMPTFIQLEPTTFPRIANPGQVYDVFVKLANPQFITSDVSCLIVDMVVAMSAAANLQIFGIGMHFDFNYN